LIQTTGVRIVSSVASVTLLRLGDADCCVVAGFAACKPATTQHSGRGVRNNVTLESRVTPAQALVGKPRLMPPCAGSGHRLVTTLPRVKKWNPSTPWACVSPNSE